MRSTHGQERVRSRKGKVRALETGRQSVFYCVRRRHGATEELGLIDGKKRRCLARAGAVHVETRVATVTLANGRTVDSPDYLWEDWYRVNVPANLTIANIERIFRADGLTDGPYWGAGRETRASGSGADPTRKRCQAARNKQAHEVERYLFPAQLVGLGFSADEIRLIESYPDAVPSDWQWSGAGWVKLTERFPLFARVYGFVFDGFQHEQLAPTAGYGRSMRRAVLLQSWIRDTLEPALAPATVSAAAPAAGHVTTSVCTCADCCKARGE